MHQAHGTIHFRFCIYCELLILRIINPFHSRFNLELLYVRICQDKYANTDYKLSKHQLCLGNLRNRFINALSTVNDYFRGTFCLQSNKSLLSARLRLLASRRNQHTLNCLIARVPHQIQMATATDGKTVLRAWLSRPVPASPVPRTQAAACQRVPRPRAIPMATDLVGRMVLHAW